MAVWSPAFRPSCSLMGPSLLGILVSLSVSFISNGISADCSITPRKFFFEHPVEFFSSSLAFSCFHLLWGELGLSNVCFYYVWFTSCSPLSQIFSLSSIFQSLIRGCFRVQGFDWNLTGNLWLPCSCIFVTFSVFWKYSTMFFRWDF